MAVSFDVAAINLDIGPTAARVVVSELSIDIIAASSPGLAVDVAELQLAIGPTTVIPPDPVSFVVTEIIVVIAPGSTVVNPKTGIYVMKGGQIVNINPFTTVSA